MRKMGGKKDLTLGGRALWEMSRKIVSYIATYSYLFLLHFCGRILPFLGLPHWPFFGKPAAKKRRQRQRLHFNQQFFFKFYFWASSCPFSALSSSRSWRNASHAEKQEQTSKSAKCGPHLGRGKAKPRRNMPRKLAEATLRNMCSRKRKHSSQKSRGRFFAEANTATV